MRRFRSFNQRGKTRYIVDGNICEHLTIEFDASAFQPADELAVGNLEATAGGIDAHDPKRSKVALFEPASDKTVTQRFLDRFLRGAIKLRFGEKETFGAAKRFMPIIPAVGTSFDSWHVFSFLICIEPGELQARAARWLCPQTQPNKPDLVRKHAAELRLIGLVRNDPLAELALSGAWL